MDTPAARFTAQLSSPHIRLTKVLSIDNREHYLQFFISDQELKVFSIVARQSMTWKLLLRQVV